MSHIYGKVVSFILIERFGPVVEKVGKYLFNFGPTSLLYIKKNNEDLPLSKIKEALCILIKYRLVKFKPSNNVNVANYSLVHENILLMLRYPKYVSLIKNKFGDECEIIIEELLEKSYWTATELILQILERLKKNNKNIPAHQIKDKFISLLNANYIIRLPYDNSDNLIPNLSVSDSEAFKPPPIDINQIIKSQTDNFIKSKYPDSDIYWTVNFDRFHQDLRDQLIVKHFARKFDENAGEFVRLLLQRMYIRSHPWTDISHPIPLIEIRDLVRKQGTHQHLLAFFDQYVNIIEQDSAQLIRKSGDTSGGLLKIYYKEIFSHFTWETIEQIILEKFDTKAARIFRLVKSKKYIESEQIQKLAMIPAKEAKRLTYQLLEENFLHLQELKKASGTGPHKCFILFHIEFGSIVRMILELCYKTLYNTMVRKNHEKTVNKRIIDKKQRVDTIIMGMKSQGADQQQIIDIEEMITPPEKEILKNIDEIMKKLNIIELEVEDTIFLLQMYLIYH